MLHVKLQIYVVTDIFGFIHQIGHEFLAWFSFETFVVQRVAKCLDGRECRFRKFVAIGHARACEFMVAQIFLSAGKVVHVFAGIPPSHVDQILQRCGHWTGTEMNG